MKTSYIILTLSLILIAGAVSLAGNNLSQDNNETCVQYELRLSSEDKYSKQLNVSEFESENFIDEKLDFEIWMTDLSKWN